MGLEESQERSYGKGIFYFMKMWIMV